MKSALVCLLTALFAIQLAECNVNRQVQVQTRQIPVEVRSAWDTMYAVARLPGDLIRKDFIAFILDLIIVSRFLPLPWVIGFALNIVYKALKFIHPAYWWLFPSTKPANVQGYGFRSSMGIFGLPMFSKMMATARLPAELLRKDFIAFATDLIELAKTLPLPRFITFLMNICNRVLKFYHPAYYFIFPSTRPYNERKNKKIKK